MAQVSVREARNNLSQLLRDVQAGGEVVIANHGTPVARLVPVQRPNGQALLAALDSLPGLDRPRTAEEIEAAIQKERDSWE
jgi:prevent-host-death family protein